MKLALLGVTLDWDPRVRSFYVTVPGNSSPTWVIGADEVGGRWDQVLGEIADKLVKARIPAGHLSKLSKIEPVTVEAASVIDEVNF